MHKYRNRLLLAVTFTQEYASCKSNKKIGKRKTERRSFTLHQLPYLFFFCLIFYMDSSEAVCYNILMNSEAVMGRNIALKVCSPMA